MRAKTNSWGVSVFDVVQNKQLFLARIDKKGRWVWVDNVDAAAHMSEEEAHSKVIHSPDIDSKVCVFPG